MYDLHDNKQMQSSRSDLESFQTLFNRHFQNAESLRNRGDHKSAIRQYKQALQFNHNDFSSLHNIGFCFYQIDDYDSTIKWMVKANTIDQSQFGTYYHMGLSFLKLNNMEQAIKSLKKATELKSQHFRARYLLGQTLYQTRRYKESIVELTVAKHLKEDDFDTHFCLGQAYYSTGNKNQAFASLLMAQQKVSNDPQSHYRLAKYFSSINEQRKAIQQYTKAKAINSEHFQTHLNLGISYQQIKNKKQAVKSFEYAKKINPKSYLPFFYLGRLFYCDDDMKLAMRQLNEAKRLNENHFDTRYYLGLTMSQVVDMQFAIKTSGKTIYNTEYMKLAVEQFTKAKQMEPNNADNLKCLGIVFIRMKEYASAKQCLQKANQLKKNDQNIQFYLAWAYGRTGQQQTAIQIYKKCLQKDPKYAQAMANLGFCLLSLNKRQQALSHYKKYLKIIPDRIQPYGGLGLLAKNFPELKQACDDVILEYKLNESQDIAIIVGVLVYYTITDNYKKTEKYFLKVIKLYEDNKQIYKIFVKTILEEAEFQFSYILELFSFLKNKIFLFKGLFLKYIEDSENVSQQFLVIDKISRENGIKQSQFLLNLFQNQVKNFSPLAQIVMANFVLCQMSKIDISRSIRNYIQLNNLYPMAACDQNQFLLRIDKNTMKQINIIQQIANILQSFLQNKILPTTINKNFGTMIDHFQQIYTVSIQIEYVKQLCQNSSSEQPTLQQILLSVIEGEQNITSMKSKWNKIPHRLSCFSKIYQLISDQESIIKSKIKLFQIMVNKRDYDKLNDIITDIDIYISVKFPINELVKLIYNSTIFHFFEDDQKPKKLAKILNEIKQKQKSYDFTGLKKQMQNITLFLQQNKGQSIKSGPLYNQQDQELDKCWKQFQSKMNQQQSLSESNADDGQNNHLQITQKNNNRQNNQKKAQQQQKKSQRMVSQSNISNHQNQNQQNVQIEYQINAKNLPFTKDLLSFDKANRKFYDEFKSLYFHHTLYIHQYLGQIKTNFIEKKPIEQSYIKYHETNKNQLQQFYYNIVPFDKIFSHDNSLQGDNREIQKLWRLNRNQLFLYMKAVAGSIEELQKYGIYHKKIDFKSVKKTGQNFKLIFQLNDLENIIFVSQNYEEIHAIESNNINGILGSSSRQFVEQLNQNIKKLLQNYLEIGFDKVDKQNEYFDNKIEMSQKSETIQDTTFRQRPEIDQIPKYIFGQTNYYLVRDFVKIKIKDTFEQTEQKVKRCIQYLQKNYKHMHLTQFKKILEKLLKHRVRLEESNAQKITEGQIQLILSIFKDLYQNKKTYSQFIHDLEKIQKKQLRLEIIAQQEDFFYQSEGEEGQQQACMIQKSWVVGNQKRETLIYLGNKKCCSQEQAILTELLQLNIKNWKLMANSSLTNLQHFVHLQFDNNSNAIVGLFPFDFFRIKNIDNLLYLKSKRIIYCYIISLASLIEELEAYRFYCINLEYDSIWIEQQQIFKFTNFENIYKMKQISLCAQNQQKIKSDLISSTDSIIGYLLTIADPQIEGNNNSKQRIFAARNKLKQIMGNQRDENITKMVQQWHKTSDMESIRTYMRKFMRDSHLRQFQSIVTTLLSSKLIINKTDNQIQAQNQNEKGLINNCLQQIVDQHKKFKYRKIDYKKIKKLLGQMITKDC